jgi:hypothetical protein
VGSKRKLNSVSYRSANRGAARQRGRSLCLVERIVSGGQTGVDRAALDFALARGLPHGGWCPRGRLAEDGALDGCYALRETPKADYPQRTEWNVRDSDGTVILTIARELTGGSALTRALAGAYGKPCLHLSKTSDGDAAPAKLREFIRRHGIKVLNVAGPRFSSEAAAGDFAAQILEAMWLGGGVRG